MANKTQIIDVTRSAVITDPEAFYENLMSTGQEDSPERTIPVVAFEGYNFLPTMYGYRSYFDTTPTLDIATLSSACDIILLYQFANYSNVLVALCEDGIWTNSGGSSAEAWVHQVTLGIPAPGFFIAWTYCVIENVLYLYRQGNGVVYKLLPTAYGPVSFATLTPTFLNMAGQMGIFRANGRLGFWDSANSVSWSGLFDFSDFTPAIETLAANAIFNDVLGRIIHVQAFGSGFIIYTTKNIVGAQFNTSGSLLFSAKSISEQAGIWTSRQVCQGSTDMEQFAYTNTGIKRVRGDYSVEDIFTEVYDFLRESRDPVYLSFLQGRYLFLSLIDPAYISGRVSFQVTAYGDLDIRFLQNGGALTIPLPPINGVPLVTNLTGQLSTLPQPTEGLYVQWQASGSKMVPGRVSSMSPYVLDDPFTVADDAPYLGNMDPLITNADLIIARDTQVLSNPVSIDNAVPSLLDLGWHDAPNGTGLTDAGLDRFKARQYREWGEYKTLVENLMANAAATPVNQILGVIETPSYLTVGLATAAHATPDVVETDLITIPYKNNAGVATETFTGVGTGTPTWEYKRTFDVGVTIVHHNVLEYSPTYLNYGEVRAFWNFPSGILTPGGSVVVGAVFAYTTVAEGDTIFNVSGGPNGPSIAGAGVTYDPDLQMYHPDNSGSRNLPLYLSAANTALNGVPAAISGTIGGVAVSLALVSAPVLATGEESIFKNFLVWYRITTDTSGSGYNYQDHTVQLVTAQTSPDGMSTFWEPGHIVLTNHEWGYNTVRNLYLSVENPSTSYSPQDSETYGTQENLYWAIYNIPVPPPAYTYTAGAITIPGSSITTPPTSLPQHVDVTYPGGTFLLQNATTAPLYPDYEGALVFDTGLKKWGKCKATYKTLLDYSPINSNHDQIITYSNFGLDAGILKDNGTIRLFSSVCTDSFIRYGKLAFSRQGYTYPEKIQINFRRPFTGNIEVDTSLDGRSIQASLHETDSFIGVGLATVYPENAGKWYTMSIGGEFDLRSIEFTGRVSGIR